MGEDSALVADARKRAAIRKTLVEWGIEGNLGDVHGWRCQYPDIYGQCDCVDRLIVDLMAALTVVLP